MASSGRLGELLETPDRAKTDLDGFESFIGEVEPRLRRALIARYGRERGREATAEALGWAWEHRDRLAEMTKPVAFLYRVGQSRSRPRKQRLPADRDIFREPEVEPNLSAAVSKLSERQRVAVMLVHGAGWTPSEVAELLSIDVSSVQTHLRRGLDSLRRALGEER